MPNGLLCDHHLPISTPGNKLRGCVGPYSRSSRRCSLCTRFMLPMAYGARIPIATAPIAPPPLTPTISRKPLPCSCSSSSFNLWWPTPSLIALLIVTHLYPVNWCSPGLRQMTGGICTRALRTIIKIRTIGKNSTSKEHTEQDHELQYQDSNEEAHGYEEEMVEHDHTQEGYS